MPRRASSSRNRRLTQRNCAASSADTNGSGVIGTDATAAREEDISHFPVRLRTLHSTWVAVRIRNSLPVQCDSSTVPGEITLVFSIESVIISVGTSPVSWPPGRKYLREGFSQTSVVNADILPWRLITLGRPSGNPLLHERGLCLHDGPTCVIQGIVFFTSAKVGDAADEFLGVVTSG